MQSFYEAFQKGDANAMGQLYHEQTTFSDPAFRNLDQAKVKGMWEMLIERSKGQLEVEFHSLVGDDKVAQCTWEAKYKFSQTGRDVHNIIHSTMEFQDGQIIKHTDQFNFWRWCRMALGIPGILLGWTPMVQNRVRKMANKSLADYMKKATS